MPFPVAIVIWGGATAIVGTVVGGVVSEYHDNHSAYSDHSDYSDRAEREKAEAAAKEKIRKDKLKIAKAELNKTLRDVCRAMSDNAGEGHAVFDEWQLSSENFSFKDFAREMGKLDATSKEKIQEAAGRVFDSEERDRKEELDEVNAMLRLLAEKRCGGK